MIQAVQTDGVEMAKVDSEITYIYKQIKKRPAVKFTRKTKLPATFVTLLRPFKGKDAPKVKVELLDTTSGMIQLKVQENNATDYIYVGDQPTEVSSRKHRGKVYAGYVRGNKKRLFVDRSEHQKNIKAHGWN